MSTSSSDSLWLSTSTLMPSRNPFSNWDFCFEAQKNNSSQHPVLLGPSIFPTFLQPSCFHNSPGSCTHILNTHRGGCLPSRRISTFKFENALWRRSWSRPLVCQMEALQLCVNLSSPPAANLCSPLPSLLAQPPRANIHAKRESFRPPTPTFNHFRPRNTRVQSLPPNSNSYLT